tara:strand:- start:247 stop:483 length:237 start_codon:yes stop_codon:yes gene_type:complete
MDIILPSKKYDKDTNSLLLFIAKHIIQITRAKEQIYKDLQNITTNDQVFDSDIQTKLAQLERSAQVLHDIARRKITKY